jgi:hypothetical protein
LLEVNGPGGGFLDDEVGNSVLGFVKQTAGLAGIALGLPDLFKGPLALGTDENARDFW